MMCVVLFLIIRLPPKSTRTYTPFPSPSLFLCDHGLRGELPELRELELAGVKVAMVHDSGARADRERRMARRFPQADVVVFGHGHDPVVMQVPDGPLLVNPGSPTQKRRQPVPTVAWLVLGSVPDARIIPVRTPA